MTLKLKMGLHLELVIAWCAFLNLVQGLNLDPRFSLIKSGPADSYFGFSLAQHQVIVDGSRPPVVQNNLLVVGAPKEPIIVQGSKYGGALYRCAMDSPRPCTYITQGLYDEPSEGDVEDDRWLGVTVASQGTGGKLVACSHRDIRSNAALGFCQVYSNSFDESLKFQPCLKFSHSQFLQDFGLCQAGMSASLSKSCAHRYVQDNAALGLCYILDQKLGDPQLSIPCDGLPHRYYLQDFGLCQAGVSARFGKDYSVIIGAPGSVFWKGVVFVANTSDALGVTWDETPSPYGDSATLTPGQQESPTQAYSYNGYASTTGKFDATKQLVYVSGAPKSHNNGEVIFFWQNKNQKSLHYEPNSILRGPIAFSGFGSSLLAVDVNNDGYDDLIVGAPYYFGKKTGGAFYVYLGGEKMITKDTKRTEVLSRKMTDKECVLLQCENARFGMSLTTLGDVNMDGFQDFAVGAPFEGNGAVYIYYGDDSEAGFNVEHAQRITAEDMPAAAGKMTSFGYALSGGQDLDENGYPDLAVGAYESNKVALIRARPIIMLHPVVTVDPAYIDLENPKGCTERKSDRQCIVLQLCLNFTTTPKDIIQSVTEITYKVEAEKQRQSARVELDGGTGDGMRVISDRTMNLAPGETKCDTEVAFVKDKSDIDDKLNPIQFTFTFSLIINKDDIEAFPMSGLQDVNLFPVISTKGAEGTEANTMTAVADFVKECGDDQKCESNLQFSSSLVDIPINDGHYELVINEDETALTMDLSVSNIGEAAYQTNIYVKKPENLTLDKENPVVQETKDSPVTCSTMGLSDFIVCSNIGNPLRKDKTVAFKLNLKVNKDMAGSMEPYKIYAWVNTSSTETTLVNDNHTISLRVINKADIYMDVTVDPDSAILVQGERRGASAIKDEIEIGAAVRNTFAVRNRGPGQVAESYLSIYWPYEVADPSGNGKYLLYLMRKPIVTSSAQTTIDCIDEDIEQYINPQKIPEVAKDDPRLAAARSKVVVDDVQPLTDEENAVRRRRDTASHRVKRATKTGSVVTLSCRDGTARCFQYKCKIGNLVEREDFAMVVMEARLWESTLLSDYKDATEVQIIAWSNVTIADKLKITQDKKNDYKMAKTSAVLDYKEKSSQSVQWWIIVVAILVGILVLAVVIFVLYKFGFFKRKRQEDMQMYKAEKKQQAMLTDYDEDGL